MNIIYSFCEIFENSAVKRGLTRLEYLPPSDCIIYAVSSGRRLSSRARVLRLFQGRGWVAP